MIKQGKDCEFWQLPDKEGFFFCDNRKARVCCPKGSVTYGCWKEREAKDDD